MKIESGHEIHLYQPAWVIEAIRQVVEAARKQRSPENSVDEAKEHHAISLPSETLDAYAGEYRLLVPPATLTVTHEGSRFYIRLADQDRVEFFAETPTDFFAKDLEAQFTFVKDASGKVTAVVLHQNGLDQTANRQP